MHWLDRVGAAAASRPRLYQPLFTGGWGEPEVLDTVLSLEAPQVVTAAGMEAWTRREDGTVRVTELRFESPGEHLPPSAGTAHARLIEPRSAQRLAVVFAAFNDHGYATRAKLARRLIRDGVAVVMLENPYYGTRRPRPAGQPLRTVADLLVMGAAAIREGLALVAHFRRASSWTIGLTGYSMGGNVAALAAAVSPGPVACAALAPAHSPGPVYTEGALAKAVDWEALGGLPEARDRLATVLGAASTTRFPPPRHGAAAVLVAATGDGYVPRHAVEALHAHWPGSELRWVPGGHASLLATRRGSLARAVVESFERLESSRRGSVRELRLG